MYNEEFGDTNGTVEEGISVEDHKANVIMDQSKTLVNGHYQIQLPSREVIEVASNSKMDFKPSSCQHFQLEKELRALRI